MKTKTNSKLKAKLQARRSARPAADPVARVLPGVRQFPDGRLYRTGHTASGKSVVVPYTEERAPEPYMERVTVYSHARPGTTYESLRFYHPELRG